MHRSALDDAVVSRRHHEVNLWAGGSRSNIHKHDPMQGPCYYKQAAFNIKHNLTGVRWLMRSCLAGAAK